MLPHTIDALTGLQGGLLDLFDNLLPKPPKDTGPFETELDELRYYSKLARKAMVFSREGARASCRTHFLLRLQRPHASHAACSLALFPCASPRARAPAGRMVFVGAATCGKTSLLRGLRAGKAAPTQGEDAPTNVLEVSSLAVGSGEEACEISCWDLGGEAAYAPCQLGLLRSAGSLYVLVVRATQADDGHYEDAVGRWLDALQACAPGASVQLVLTQCDRYALGTTPKPYPEAVATQREWLTRRVRQHRDEWRARSGSAGAAGGKAWAAGLNVLCDASGGPSILCVSSISGGAAEESLRKCRDAFHGLVLASDPAAAAAAAALAAEVGSAFGAAPAARAVVLEEEEERRSRSGAAAPAALRSIGQQLPKSWQAAVAMLAALRDGHAPLQAAQAAGLKGGKQLKPTEHSRAYVPLAEVRALWKGTVAPALTPPASIGTVDDALALLCDQGKAYVSAGVVHLDPQHALRFITPLVDMRISRGQAQKMVIAYLQTCGRLPPASRSLLFGGKVPPESQRLLEGMMALVKGGELREEVLPVLWGATSGIDAAEYERGLCVRQCHHVNARAARAAACCPRPADGNVLTADCAPCTLALLFC